MDSEIKKDLVKKLLIRKLKQVSEPIKIAYRKPTREKKKKRIALIDLYATKSLKKNMDNVYNY